MKLDSISNIICSVIDSAELTRSIHSCQEWRNSSENSFLTIASFISQLNTDVDLYNSVVKLEALGMPSFTDEEKRMIFMLKSEFERDGIHKDADTRESIRQVVGDITDIETQFSQNLTAASLPTSVLGKALELDYHRYSPATVLQHSTQSTQRKEAYYLQNTICPENVSVLHGLVRQREVYASLLGYESYGEKNVDDKMANSVANVNTFLDYVKQKHIGSFKSQMELLREIKMKSGEVGGIEPWDLQYYMNVYRNECNGDNDITVLSDYFSINSVLSGFQKIVNMLWGVEMREEEFEEGECWVDDRSGVKKYVFYGKDNEIIGKLYFDLFPRKDKYTHAAHFTIRCGCKFYTSNSVIQQTPIVAVVVNVQTNNCNANCNYHDIETLSHEFGHALHSLLSRTQFQHLSGTRGPTDFVEIPSHLFEYLLTERDVIKLLSKRNNNGEGITDDLIATANSSKVDFSGIDAMTQAMYADYDQRLFGRHNSSPIDSTAILKSVHEDYNIAFAEGTHWQSTFGHVNTYGSVYYSYLWAQCIARDIFNSLEKANPEGATGLVNPESGQRIFSLLSPGSSRDPYETIKNALGGESWQGYRESKK
jgi:intermediate peptidase